MVKKNISPPSQKPKQNTTTTPQPKSVGGKKTEGSGGALGEGSPARGLGASWHRSVVLPSGIDWPVLQIRCHRSGGLQGAGSSPRTSLLLLLLPPGPPLGVGGYFWYQGVAVPFPLSSWILSSLTCT